MTQALWSQFCSSVTCMVFPLNVFPSGVIKTYIITASQFSASQRSIRYFRKSAGLSLDIKQLSFSRFSQQLLQTSQFINVMCWNRNIAIGNCRLCTTEIFYPVFLGRAWNCIWKIQIPWDVIPCQQINIYRRFKNIKFYRDVEKYLSLDTAWYLERSEVHQHGCKNHKH